MRPCRPRQDIQWHLVGYTDTQRGDQRAPSVCQDEWGGCGVSHRRESCRMVGRACRQDYRCIRTPHGRASCVWEEESWLGAKASALEGGLCHSRKQMCKLLRWRCGALKTRAVDASFLNLSAKPRSWSQWGIGAPPLSSCEKQSRRELHDASVGFCGSAVRS